MGSGDDPAAANLYDYNEVGLYSFQEIIQPFIRHFKN